MNNHIPIPPRGVDYRNKIVLAPMVRSGELPSRLLALRYGADLVWGPETVDRALIGTVRRHNPITGTIDFTRLPSNSTSASSNVESVIYRLHPDLEGKKLIYQIGTASPDLAVQAASLIARDVAGIDVNAGCPKPFSTLGGMGAALLQTPDTLCSILRALVEKVGGPFEIGISVKIRLLETAEQTRELVTKLCGTGITGLTIHCRTTPMRPRERAIREQLKMITEICKENGVACLMNGDVASREEGIALAEQYGADGGMIATAAEKNPSCFRKISDGGMEKWEKVVEEYVELALSVDNRWANTKFLLSQMIPGKSPLYLKVARAKSYSELTEIMGLTGTYGKKASEVDSRLGLDKSAQVIEEGKRLTKGERKAKARLEQEAAQLRKAEKEQQVNKKRKASDAGLEHDRPDDIKTQSCAPGTVVENRTTLLV